MAHQILVYSVITVLVSLTLGPVAPTGWLQPFRRRRRRGGTGLGVHRSPAPRQCRSARRRAQTHAAVPLVQLVSGAGARCRRGRHAAAPVAPTRQPLADGSGGQARSRDNDLGTCSKRLAVPELGGCWRRYRLRSPPVGPANVFEYSSIRYRRSPESLIKKFLMHGCSRWGLAPHR